MGDHYSDLEEKQARQQKTIRTVGVPPVGDSEQLFKEDELEKMTESMYSLAEQLNFYSGNVIKYCYLAYFLPDPEDKKENLEEALWYLKREIDRLEKL